MSELIPPPADWKFRLDRTKTQLTSDLAKHRLLSIKTYLNGSERVYAAVSVKNEKLGGSWNGRISQPNLKTALGTTLRLTALDCFEEKKKTFCAAAWIDNPTPIKWNWGIDFTSGKLGEILEKDNGKLISLRAYKTTLGGQLANEATRYCAVWVEDDGVEWDWIADDVVDSIEDTLDANSARLISIDNLDNKLWLGDDEHFCAVWYKNTTGQPWFWNAGLNKSKLQKEAPKFCSWGLDVAYCSKTRFVSLMEQYPKPADPDLTTLVSLTGSGTATIGDDLWESIQMDLSLMNLTSDPVTLESAFWFSAAEGGWCWWSGNLTDPSGQTLLGLPLSLNPSQTSNATTSGVFSNCPKIYVFPVKAVGLGSTHQYVVSQAVISQASFPSPAPLPINWPVFLGIQAPVEVVKLTNKKYWCTVAGQIVNGTGDKLDVANVLVKLKDQGNVTIHKAYLADKLRIDQDILGIGLDPVLDGPVSNSDAPLPKFYDGFEVPRTFTNGKLKVQANVKFRSGELDCYGDERLLDVALAPETVMSRLPYDIPIIGGSPDPSFLWRWGNGVGGTSFNAHSYPEHRYSYDIGVIDVNGSTFADQDLKDQNDNYYCWEQKVLAMIDGEVVFVANDFEDHFGNVTNPNSKGANAVVIYNSTLDCFHLYVHFKQGSIVVSDGDTVSTGDMLGQIGNSGGSSEPHLHLGISRRDANGFVRSLPITFEKIKDGSGASVSGVPADGESYIMP